MSGKSRSSRRRRLLEEARQEIIRTLREIREVLAKQKPKHK